MAVTSERFVDEIEVDASKAEAGIRTYETAIGRAAAASSKLKAAAGDAEAATEKTTAAQRVALRVTEQAERALARYVDRHDPAVRAQQALEKAENAVATARRRGIEVTEQQTRTVEMLRQKVETLKSANNDAANAAGRQAEAMEAVRVKYDASYASVRAYQNELARVTAILDGANASEEMRARILGQVAAAYDPVTRAANQAAEAQERAAEAQRRMIADARASLAASTSQQDINALFGIGSSSNSAAASAAVFEEAERAAKAEAEALEQLRLKARALTESIDPAAKAQRLFTERMAEADDLLVKGLISYEQHAIAAKRYHDSMRVATGAANDFAVAEEKMSLGLLFKANPYLSRNIQDVSNVLIATRGDILSAIPALIDLKDQFGDAYTKAKQMSGGSKDAGDSLANVEKAAAGAAPAIGAANNAAKEAGKSLLGMVGSAAAAVAPWVALAAAVAGLAYSFTSYRSSVKEAEKANGLMGDSLGLTSSQLKAFAEAAADAGNVSAISARSMIAEYIRAGKIVPAVITELISITRDYAAATGKDATEATADLAKMMQDPARAAADLAEKYNLLSGAQLVHIQRLTESGQRAQAQTILTDALGQRIKGAAEQTSIWARAWEAVWTNAGNAANAVGRAVDRAMNGKSLTERIDEARDAMLRAREAATPRTAGLIASRRAFDEQLAEARDEANAAEQRYNDLMEQQREQNRAAATQRVASENNAASRAAGGIADGYDEVGRVIRTTQADIDKLKKGLGIGMGEAAGVGQRALEGLQNRLADYQAASAAGLDMEAYKRKQLADLETKYAGTVGPQRGKLMAGERAQIEMLGTATTKAERRAAADDATAQAAAGVTQAAAQQTQQLTLQTAAQERLAAAAGQGEAAMRRASIENEVAAATLQGLGEATRAALEAQEAATRAQIHADFVGAINLEVAASERLVAGMQKGGTAWRDAETYAAAYAQTLKEVPYPKTGESVAEWNKRLQENIDLIEKQKKALDSKAFADYGKQLEAQTRQLQLQAKLVGASPQQAARLQSEHDINELLIAQGRTYESLSEGERAVIDAARGRAVQNADLEQQIARQKDAYDTIANSLEKSFERVGDALVEAFVEGKGSAVDFGNVAKAILSSLLTDLVKMSVIRPFTNAVFGGNAGTIYDLAGSAANQNGGMGGAGNLLSLGSKFIPSSWTSSITTAIDGWGASTLGIGSASAPGLTAASGGLANAAGVAAVPGGVTNAAVAPGAVSGGLTSYLGPIGGGFAAGYMLGPMLANGNKAVGGLAGAASGAAVGALIGSVIPGIGTLVGALIGGASGGLGGLIGTQKPTVGPTASADITINAGGKSASAGNFLVDNDGKIEDAQNLGAAFSTIFSAAASGGGTLTKDFGIGRTAAKGLYVAGSVPYQEFGTGEDALGKLLRYTLLDEGGLQNAGANVTKAIQRTKATTYEDAAKDIALGASIDAGNTALAELDRSLNSVTKAARTATTESMKPMLDELARAKSLDLGAEYVDLATGQITAYLDALKNPVEWTQAEQDMASLTGQFDAIREAVQQLNPELVTYVNQIEAETRARIKADAQASYLQQLNEAQDRGYINSINELIKARDINQRSWAAVGLDPANATTLFNTQLTKLLETLEGSQLSDVATSFGGSIADLAATIQQAAQTTAAATAAAERAAYNADLKSRMYAVLGNDRMSGLVALDQQQAVELAQAKAAGRDTTLLQQVQAAERATKAFDLAQTDLLAAYDQQLGAQQDYISELTNGAVKIAQSARQFRAAFDALALNDNSPLSDIDRLKEARRQFGIDYATYKDRTKSDDERDAAKQDLLSLGPSLVQLARDYFGPTDRADYDWVRSVLAEFGDTTALGVDTAEQTLVTANNTLKEMQKARADAAAMGQKQYGALTDLAALAEQSKTAMLAALAPLATLAPRNWGAPESVAANKQLAIQTGYAGDFGGGGWQAWITQQPDSVKAIARQVLTQMGQAWRINGFAIGTDAAPPGLAWVGERGPELIQMAGGERVYPHAESMALAQSWASAANDRFPANVITFRPPSIPTSGSGAGGMVAELRKFREEARQDARAIASTVIDMMEKQISTLREESAELRRRIDKQSQEIRIGQSIPKYATKGK